MTDAVADVSRATSEQRLRGKTAIITGAASGMGRASVERYLAEGASVMALDIDADGLEALARAHPESPLATARVDVCSTADVESSLAAAVDRFGPVDVYFANAGVPFAIKEAEAISDDEWGQVIAVNLTSVFIAARAVVPHMRGNGGGSIIVTASMAALRPRPKLSPYTAAKAGAVGLSKGLAVELAADDIRVNAICPVATNTPMLARFGMGGHTGAEEYHNQSTPLGRLAEPWEVAAVGAFLAMDDARFLTGLAIPVDGGRSI